MARSKPQKQVAEPQDVPMSGPESVAPSSIETSLLGTTVRITSGAGVNSNGRVVCVTLEVSTVFLHLERTTVNAGTYIKVPLLNVRKVS